MGPTQDSQIIHCPNPAPRRSLIQILWSGGSRGDPRGARIAASSGDSPPNSTYVFYETTTWKRHGSWRGDLGTWDPHLAEQTRVPLSPVELSPAHSSGARIRSWISGPGQERTLPIFFVHVLVFHRRGRRLLVYDIIDVAELARQSLFRTS